MGRSTATVQDLKTLANYIWRRPQNLPGTWDQYPNWRLPVADASGRPLTLEELTASPRANALLSAVREGVGTRTAPPGARPL